MIRQRVPGLGCHHRNARSPSVEWHVDGISTVDKPADRRRCCVEWLETGQMVSAR